VYHYKARLVRVVDADTVVLDVDLGFGCWRVNEPYRLLRINAPELRYKSGKAARAFLTAFLNGKELEVVTHKSDVYGRYLAELTTSEGVNVSDYLVEHRHARYKDY
jgi:micrococcal nuclease